MFKEWLERITEYEMQLYAMLDIIGDMENLYNRLNTLNVASELTAEEQKDAINVLTDVMHLHSTVSKKLKELGLV